ncbi:MAG: TAXI family TRAP transporter solute-binding subunit [Proteobacteria bacterium]|nr:TAXI family TRAP transporter solute-binding subunit [Pseudomonadota bacterium]
MRKLIVATLALALAAGAFLIPDDASAQGKKRFISIGTGGPTGVYFVTGNAICRMVHKAAAEGRKKGRKHGIRCAAPSTAGSTYNIGQVREGELDFGVAQSDWQYHAYNGSDRYKGKAFKKLRAIFSVHPEPIQIIVGKGSGIKSWGDLKGKRVNIGNPGSGQRGTMDFLMKAHGWDKSAFKLATELTSTEQTKALCDGKIDAIFYTVGVPNSGVSIATDGCDAKIIDFTTDVAKKIVKERPYYTWATIPKGTYKTTDKNVTTFGPITTFITSTDVPDDVVYEVVRAVFENLDDFKRLHPAFKNLDPKRMVTDGLSAPLHAGALKYYKEKGLK